MQATIRTNLDSIFVDGNDHEVYYSMIIATMPNGARYALRDSECNHYYYTKHEGLKRIDDDIVYAKMQPLVDRINAAQKIDYQYWTEIEPEYGSERYCNPGIQM